jgi:hypothetical protein
MCEACDAGGIWVCCGGVMDRQSTCRRCGCTVEQDAAACELFEAMEPARIARGDYPGDRELIQFKRAHGFGRRSA